LLVGQEKNIGFLTGHFSDIKPLNTSSLIKSFFCSVELLDIS